MGKKKLFETRCCSVLVDNLVFPLPSIHYISGRGHYSNSSGSDSVCWLDCNYEASDRPAPSSYKFCLRFLWWWRSEQGTDRARGARN